MAQGGGGNVVGSLRFGKAGRATGLMRLSEVLHQGVDLTTLPATSAIAGRAVVSLKRTLFDFEPTAT